MENKRYKNIEYRIKMIATILIFVALVNIGNVTALTDQEQLGKDLFFDTNLSTPNGEVCGTCHPADSAFASTDAGTGVSEGAVNNRYGFRNAPSTQYVSFNPEFHFDTTLKKFVGGIFRDGRANNLVDQAQLPFLNRLEMNDPNKKIVVMNIRNGEYADLFRKVYGPNSLDPKNVDTAYLQMAKAIVAFEGTNELNKFTSKFDYYIKGQAVFTPQEKRGLDLFTDPNNTCDTCHHTTVGPFSSEPLFTDFTYGNPGFPSNLGMLGDTPALKAYFPYYFLSKQFNPDGLNFIDRGLGEALKNSGKYPSSVYTPEFGKFKVPSLRNVAITAPYGHNGVFKTLKEVVHLYNTRDTLGNCATKTNPIPGNNCWPLPEVPQTKNILVGHLGLSDGDENDIVAFLNTLTDGYIPH